MLIIAANQQIFRSLGLSGTLNGDSSNKEEIRTTPKGSGRAGKDLERINKEMHMKLPIHIFEGKKRPEVPRQAVKLATEAGIVQFSMDTTSKPVISACADMLKSSQRQMRYKLKKKYFDN
ncbi:hypothetical protein EJB05_50412, partial [Eragrostis curvula]